MLSKFKVVVKDDERAFLMRDGCFERLLGTGRFVEHLIGFVVLATIAKLRREQYGQSSERGRKVLDQLELQLEELAAETSENAVAAEDKAAGVAVKSFARQRPVRAPLPATPISATCSGTPRSICCPSIQRFGQRPRAHC